MPSKLKWQSAGLKIQRTCSTQDEGTTGLWYHVTMKRNGVRYSSRMKQRARSLRRAGWSLGRLSLDLGVSKSTASAWTKKVILTTSSKKELSKWGRLRRVATGAMLSKLADDRAEKSLREARKLWLSLWLDPFFLWGVGFYAGDGNRRSPVFGVTNANFDVVRTWLDWFRCFVGERVQLKARIVVHSSGQSKAARLHWAGLLGKYGVRLAGIGVYVSSASGRKRPIERLPYGTVHVVQGIGSRLSHVRMMEWIRLANTPGWRNWKRSGL